MPCWSREDTNPLHVYYCVYTVLMRAAIIVSSLSLVVVNGFHRRGLAGVLTVRQRKEDAVL